jgi:hypothetical protein
MVALGTIHDWSPAAAQVVSWHASPSVRAKARQAAISAVPASYQQAQHLRGFYQRAAHGLDMARLCIGAWDVAGVCDIPVMTDAINAHLRRHDTYHSWFEYKNPKDIVRRTIRDLPAITIYVDLDDWNARAKALGGNSNSLFAGFAAKVAERFGRRRAGDGAVTLWFQVSDHTEYDMRANALSFVNVSVAGVDHGSLALPLSRYPKMTGFTEASNA